MRTVGRNVQKCSSFIFKSTINVFLLRRNLEPENLLTNFVSKTKRKW